ncbi:MAG TPA: NAD(P)-dependent oxidoreductase [Phycisphaeraceae bacterium]
MSDSNAQRRPRVLVTGGTGRVASGIADDLARDFDLLLTDVREPEQAVNHPFQQADLADVDRLTELARGCDAVVHLAIASQRYFMDAPEQAWNDEQMRVNIMGTQHVFEAARLAGVPRMVYMSSLTINLADPRPSWIRITDPPRPRDLYALTKLFGEQLGELYSRKYGMTVICLRLGQPFPLPNWGLEVLKRRSARGLMAGFEDIAQAVRCGLTVPDFRYKVAAICSESDVRYIDLTEAAQIGYHPRQFFTEEGIIPCSAAKASPPGGPTAAASEPTHVR